MLSHVKIVACVVLGILASIGSPIIGGALMLIGHWLTLDNNDLFYRSMLPSFVMAKSALKLSKLVGIGVPG